MPDNNEDRNEHDQAVLNLLGERSADQAWWLAYLDTGAEDVVFPTAPMLTLHAGWHYLLVEAGPKRAAGWRSNDIWS